ADDMILFCHPTLSDVTTVKSILQLFGRASGLRVNFAKSTATLIRAGVDEVAPVVDSLGCPIVELPITYLGLPCWKAHLMNKAGRLAFVKSILSAIPIHQLLALPPPPQEDHQGTREDPTWLPLGRAHGGK
uniref:Reverse transcriptase domain-containing protein n=1 Tax=Aegilops tauschii subsp. strangulata TaxID=200361 RepID=A0A452Y171_AEGTS